MRSLSLLVALALFSGLDLEAQNVSAQRAKAIEQTKSEINKELGAAGGDWQEWFSHLAPFRKALSDKFDAIDKEPRKPANQPNAHAWNYFRADGNPPLFVQHYSTLYLFADNQNADTYIKHRLMESTPQAFATASTFPSVATLLAFSKWLRSANVDLIFVPVPKMIEVYANKVVPGVPPDGIVAPHMRKLFFDLLSQDIEIVDLLPSYLAAAKADPEPLFMPADSHWSDRAQQIAARLIAERLARYPFVKDALAKPKRYRTVDFPWTFAGSDFDYLTPVEQQEVQSHAKKPLIRVNNLDGSVFEEQDDAPVLIAGDSYASYSSGAIAKGTGIGPLLANAINLPITVFSNGGGTTQPMTDLIRDQESLKVHKVLIWIISMDQFTWPLSWDMPPFPAIKSVVRK